RRGDGRLRAVDGVQLQPRAAPASGRGDRRGKPRAGPPRDRGRPAGARPRLTGPQVGPSVPTGGTHPYPGGAPDRPDWRPSVASPVPAPPPPRVPRLRRGGVGPEG